ncbi:TlpA family protein disulfide reductase [Pedobacter sp. SL55]|uniref:TlpA family protein disulfide reductase n=1 Tax=Pedobacter sp. SL55 TaxID=2995161 RepID=UPI0022711EAC|nr:TlpA disulfide reductase family protein [Pedobacter sp. SL55]WAC41400.1 TlpA disulfide reductase family protein [Pedobacter sp. SL55]
MQQIFRQILATLFLIKLLPCAIYAQDTLIVTFVFPKQMEQKEIIFKQHLFSTPLIKMDNFSEEAQVKSQVCVIKVPTKGFERYSIALKERPNKQVFFELGPGIAEVKFLDTLLNSYKVMGNKANAEYTESMKLSDRSKYIQSEVNEALKKLIKNNPSSILNFDYLLELENKIPDSELLEIYNSIKDSIVKNSKGVLLNYIIENLYEGRIAPNFIQPDTNGVDIQLSDFRGKYVLLDFWASWCVPCRQEHPQYRELNKNYATYPFEIVSVSFDDDKNKWMKAIREDKIQAWSHLSDLHGIGNSVYYKYRIRYVPVSYLLDPDGRIIGKNLRGKELVSTLNKIFPNK